MNIYHKIIQFLNQSASQEELDQVEAWKNQSTENLKALQEITKIHAAAEKLKDFTPVDEEQAWNKVSNKAGIDKEAKVFRIPNFVKASAAILIICLSAFFIVQNNVDSGSINLYSSGETSQNVQLADGSNVVLDSESTLEVITDRYVELDGRASFKVTTTPDKENFTIKIKGGKITVLGTEFTVLSSNGMLEVNVTEGHVKLDYEGRSIDCYANDVVRLNDGAVILTKNNYDNIDSWISNELKFNEEPISNVLSDISKHFKVNFTIEDGLIMESQCLLTSTFINPTIEDVIKEISTILEAKIIKQNKSYVIVSINC